MDLEGLSDRIAATGDAGRYIVAIAGPPGSGKSTFAEQLAADLNERKGRSTSVVAMDGFHFDDLVLVPAGERSRKGAPHTFDVDGFAALIRRLRADDGRRIAVPVFDRTIEIARAGARIIDSSVRVILVEGNYLLLKEPSWMELHNLFDLTVALRVPEPVLSRRLFGRWEALGLDADAIESKLATNDLPNVHLVLQNSREADLTIDN